MDTTINPTIFTAENDHCLEAVVPLIASDDKSTKSTCVSQKTHPTFKCIAFIYRLFTFIITQFAREESCKPATFEKLLVIKSKKFHSFVFFCVKYIGNAR